MIKSTSLLLGSLTNGYHVQDKDYETSNTHTYSRLVMLSLKVILDDSVGLTS